MTSNADTGRATPIRYQEIPVVEAWGAAIEFLLIGDRALALAEAHPLLEDSRCGRCSPGGCAAAELASEALAVLAARNATNGRRVRPSSVRCSGSTTPL
jgi:hypothetical protein